MVPQRAEATEAKLITGEDLAAMGYLGRCELIEGRIVKLDFNNIRHGAVVGNFCGALGNFEKSSRVGKAMVGGVGIYTCRNPDTVRGADVLFISKERVAQIKSPSYLDVAPELVVEVMSPEDRWIEVTEKLGEYFQIGVKLVWVANPKDLIVYAYRSLTDVRQFTPNDMLPGDDVLPGFSASVATLFED